MALSESLIAVLACPKSKQPLVYFPRGEAGDDDASGFLLCPASRLRYRIDDGVPVLLVEEAQEVPAQEVDRLIARARDLGLAVP
ncbi:MAG: Trm112 family protein [Kofleriaceae bacterium]|nr:Trm112 family protein [Kofleriaceae bacterium]